MKNKFINFGAAQKFIFAVGLLFIFAQIFRVEIDAQQTRKKTTAQASKKKAPAKNPAVKNSANKKTSTVSSLKVTQIDAPALRNLIARDGANAKPLLVNFWATWCPPCVEEFPELVKIDRDYKDKIDFIVVSLDDLAEINRDVPKFLIDMKASMPAYLLKTQDEQAAISSIAKTYQGALPFTVLFDGAGKIAYTKSGKANAEILRGEIEKILAGETNRTSESK